MNSPTEKQPDSMPDGPPAPMPPQQQVEINPEVLILAKQKLMLAKVVWYLLINHSCSSGQSHAIDENNIPDLWNLGFQENEKGHLIVRAEMLPEITDKQIANVVEFLLGTKKSIYEAIEKFSLVQPAQYVESMIRDYVVLYEGQWISAHAATHQPDAN